MYVMIIIVIPIYYMVLYAHLTEMISTFYD